MSEERYKSDQDFRRALEQRLATTAQRGGRGLVRERQVLIFERFLARTVAMDMGVVVKGGMALELRTARAKYARHRCSGDGQTGSLRAGAACPGPG